MNIQIQRVKQSVMGDNWYDADLYAGLIHPAHSIHPLRIIHICKYFPPDRGGMETYVRDLAVEQAAAGHEVQVLAHGTRTVTEALAPRCRVHRCKTWFCLGNYAPVAPRLPLLLWKICKQFQPHIVHVHCPNPAALYAGLPFLQGRHTGLPLLVVHWHSDVLFPAHKSPSRVALALWRHGEAALLRKADRIIATSRPYLDSSAFLAPWRDKCVVAPLRLSDKTRVPPCAGHHPAIDFLRSPVGDTTLAVLSVGRLSHYKGFDILLRAVAKVPNARCCIVGEGEERAALQSLTESLKIHDRVLHTGNIDDTILSACYEACHVFCLPSTERTEAFGLVILEAQRAGKRCIVSDVPGSGMGTLVQHGANGWLVPPGDVDGLANALALMSEQWK